MSEVMLKKEFEAKLSIFTFLTPEGQTIDMRSNLTTYPCRAVNGLSFFFRAALALLVHELERMKLKIVEMVDIGNILTLMTSGDLTFDLTLKMTEVLSY